MWKQIHCKGFITCLNLSYSQAGPQCSLQEEGVITHSTKVRQLYWPSFWESSVQALCKSIVLVSLSFLQQEVLSDTLVVVMHPGTGEREWSSSAFPVCQSQTCLKMNPKRELSANFLFYFHGLSWWEGKIGEREKSSCEMKSWGKLYVPNPFNAFWSQAHCKSSCLCQQYNISCYEALASAGCQCNTNSSGSSEWGN